MAVQAPATDHRPPGGAVAEGRGLFWLGLALCLVGVPLMFAQMFALKWFFTPWYSPALATVGALVLLGAALRKPGVARVGVFILMAAFAGLQWFFHGVMMRLPEYAGPKAGESLVAFQAATAEGKPFTDTDLRDGSRRAMVFFRGRW